MSKKIQVMCVFVIIIVASLIWPAGAAAAPPMHGPVIHIVQWGENLTSISKRYGVSIQDIVAANHLANPNRIYVGQRLVIPLTPGPSAEPSGDAVRHLVQSGDTLSSLAVRYHSTVHAIVQANKLVNPSYIYVGQVLIIPTASPALPKEGVYYVVRAGDTLAKIAYQYQVSSWTLAQINNLTNPSLIYVGQTLFIPGADAAAPTPTKAVSSALPTATPTATTTAVATRAAAATKTVAAMPTSLQCTPAPLKSTPAPPKCRIPTVTPIPLGAIPLPAPGPVKPLQMNSPEYGMEINVWNVGDCVTDRDLRLVKEAGFTWVKQLFPWREIEVEKGKFMWGEADRIVGMAAKYNLDLAVAISLQPDWAGDGYPVNGPPRNMADIADFMSAIARRYKGLVRAYEIWPGPNVSRNWGGQSPDPYRYAEMLRNAYWYAKEQDPFVMIISGGLVQTAQYDSTSMPPEVFFKTLYFETEAKLTCDVFGIQALGFKAAPENTPDEAARAEMNNNFPATRELNRTWCFRSVEVLHAIQGETPPHWTKDNKQWAVTRMGWTTDTRERSLYKWAAVSRDIQGDYLRRAYRWAKDHWSGWMGVMFVPLTNARWTMNDDGYWWAIANPDGCPRPAYYSLKGIAK